ncbi:endolytic transglycosylase MltG [Aliidiomarina shirensis]|uniref:Endolytic murein transglycosylase n=1 Tax=Aliidiomarina shirensis TaxID=1048642 RepID=A0A432WXC6_9GAMM|nr:endolytic transglycosylase MltG [Aliidiomarina shirensis]RUO38391.1 endolytic transglycosylase MltG [Aliidiomarina shirensis]
MKKAIFSVLAVGLALTVITAVSGYAAANWWYHQGSAVRLTDHTEQEILFEVPRGSNPRRIAKALEAQGLVPYAKLNELSFRFFHQGARVQAGVYAIRNNDTAAEIWNRISAGQQHLFSITFVEGSEFRQWQQQILAHEYLTVENPAVTAEALAEELSEGEYTHIEGLLFPDTYRFYAGTTDTQLYRQAYERMQNTVSEAWQTRDRSVPVATPYEALILASIIEKETGAVEERALVASVFVNRLRTGMRLQSDPTIIYGLGDAYRGVIYRSDIQQTTPYNTYRINGLPPTPIAMPGKAAIVATLAPVESDYYYFVSRNDGTHVFSRTLAEHNRAVQRYQRN